MNVPFQSWTHDEATARPRRSLPEGRYGGTGAEEEGPIRGSMRFPGGGSFAYDGDLIGLGLFFGIATVGLIREVRRGSSRR